MGTNLRSWIDECEGSEGESTVECEGSEGELMPEYEGSDIGDGGVIGDGEWGYRRPSWAYWQQFINGFGFGTVANGYRRWLPEPSRMVRND